MVIKIPASIHILFFSSGLLFTDFSGAQCPQHMDRDQKLTWSRNLIRAHNGVVTIKSRLQNDPEWQRVGSGFVFGTDTFILTRQDVLGRNQRFLVVFPDGRKGQGRLLHRDPETGIVVLENTVPDTPPLPAGTSRGMTSGWPVCLLGNSMGFFPSLTMLAFLDYTDGNMLKFKAQVAPGNIGGPVMDQKGHVVGMLASIESGEDASDGNSAAYAIPIEMLRHVFEGFLDELSRQPGWVGLSVLDLDDRKAFRGVRVVRVEPDGPGDQAEICVGDTIVQFNGRFVSGAAVLADWVGKCRPMQRVTFSIRRGGDILNHEVRISRPDLDEGSLP